MNLQDLLEAEILNAPMVEMANLFPAETGLQRVIWFGEVGGQHGPRIKVSNTPGQFDLHNNFVVSVSHNPYVLTPRSMKISSSDLQDVLDWVILNYDDLMKLWKIYESGNGSTIEILSALQKV